MTQGLHDRFLLLVLLVSKSLLALCGPSCAQSTPIILDIKNVTFSDGSLMRGLAVHAGSPAQPLAMQLAADANNTIVYDTDTFCQTSDAGCAAGRGGLFDETRSSTWAPSSNSSDEVSEAVPGKVAGALWGSDDFGLTDQITVEKFPFGIARNGNYPMNSVGLGRNSTLLNSLYSSGRIASKTWSLFVGLVGASASAQMDGSLVLGGFDKAKTKGSNFTSPFVVDLVDNDGGSRACSSGLQIQISNIIMNFKNGTNFSIIKSSLEYCIQPDYPIITMPQPLWQSFSSYAGGTPLYSGSRSTGINMWGMTFEARGVYDGDLTFVSSSGSQYTITNDQLVVPDYYVNSQGQRYSNDSSREILINSLQDINENDMPILGRTFLTAAYLSVDLDVQQFTLWQSRPTQSQDIVSLGPNTTCTGSANGPSKTSNPTPSTTPIIRPLSRGAIVGVVIGISSAICVLICVFILLRKRRLLGQHSKDFKDLSSHLSGSHGTFELNGKQAPLELVGSGGQHEMYARPRILKGSSHPPSLHELPANDF